MSLQADDKEAAEIAPTVSQVRVDCGVRGDWWCPGCKQYVLPQHVTYEETHDTRAGGCGCHVLPEIPIMEMPFEHRQQVRTEEMEALRSLEKSMLNLEKAYENMGLSAGMATEAVQSCIDFLNEHIDARANSL